MSTKTKKGSSSKNLEITSDTNGKNDNNHSQKPISTHHPHDLTTSYLANPPKPIWNVIIKNIKHETEVFEYEDVTGET